MVKRKDDIRPPWSDSKLLVRQKIVRFFVHVLAWIGIAVLYYAAFSFFFDTPLEYKMKKSTSKLRKEYEVLNERFDSINLVLNNVIERDRNVFKILFEAEPYDFDEGYEENRLTIYEKLLDKSNKELSSTLSERVKKLEKGWIEMGKLYRDLWDKSEKMGDKVNFIPSIQPIVNPDLTLLTASFGLRMHPFYKTLVPHMGVDYTVPEGSRVFATADGRVKDILSNFSTNGLTVILSHGNGYETQYSHLSKVTLRRGEEVKRGEIIALSGNTGLSLAPHLHYEVKHNGLRVDPIHYFFMELSPSEYRKLMSIARSGMQSFD